VAEKAACHIECVAKLETGRPVSDPILQNRRTQKRIKAPRIYILAEPQACPKPQRSFNID